MILFISPNFHTFVKNDYEILDKYTEVRRYQYQQGKTVFIHLSSQLKLLFWLIRNIRKAGQIYCWFADYHSFLPVLFAKIFRKKSFLVLGGYDVIHLPEIGYGSLKNPLRRFCAKFSIANATTCLAVSNYVKKQCLSIVPCAKVKTVYNGVDTSIAPLINIPKENIVLTVGAGETLQRIRLKGIDLFCEVAKRLPKYQFIVIGLGENARKYLNKIPENLQIIPPLAFPELITYYQKARVYCQFSLVESFGMALAEAMLFECMPVVTNAGAMPEIVGELGIILESQTTGHAAKMVEKALELQPEKREKIRNRILENFKLERREEEICQILGLTDKI